MTIAFDHSRPVIILAKGRRPGVKSLVSRVFSALSDLALPLLATLVGYGMTLALFALLEYSI